VAHPSLSAARYRALGLWAGQTLGDWFAERAGRFSSRIAVVDGARRVSYTELAARVEAIARGFYAAGLRELDRVVLQLPNGVALIETLLGLIRLGAVPVLALPAHRRVELEAFCQRARAVGLVLAERQGSDDLLPLASSLRATCPCLKWVWVESPRPNLGLGFGSLAQLRDAGAQVGHLPAAQFDSSDVALLQLSGGSTGIPKLIPRTHDDYLYCVRASAELCELNEATKFLAVLPMTHNFTLCSPGILGVFQAGGTVVSAPHPLPGFVFELFEREQITLAAAVPSLVRSWVDSKARYLGDRRLADLTLQVGGAKLDSALASAVIESFGCRLQQVFGMAEGLVNYTRLDDPPSVVLQTQGRPLSPQDEARIVDPVDPEGPALPDDCVGELQTRGPYTIRGYFDDRANDSRHFTSDGFYRTGDLVRRLANGNWVVEGRLGDRILRGGEKIDPEQVESHLREHPSVGDAALIGIADEYLGERSLAFVTLAPGAREFSTADARSFLRARGLSEFKLPDGVHVIEELPRTKIGKTDKQALRASFGRSWRLLSRS
jgi:2,3-dihydroxybenzoate-AMP ligase